MIQLQQERDPVERLLEEYAERLRRGDEASVEELAAGHPELAERLRELAPAVALMEQLGCAQHDAGGGRGFTPPERLGDFRILREIGRGGMGVVYEAEQASLGRRVAVKVLPQGPGAAERRRWRFQFEAQTAGRMRHTNIVPVFGVGEGRGLHYYVMPLVPAAGLDEIVDALRRPGIPPAPPPDGAVRDAARRLAAAKFGSGARLPEAREAKRETHFQTVARIGRQVAQALAHAHGQGVVHRDIKPSNLLVDPELKVHVADFGLAQAVERASEDAAGTPRYMAPEQWRGRADARTDIYCLGLTLYELATLQPPAEANRRGQGAEQSARRKRRGGQAAGAPDPRRLAPALPRDLAAILAKCLAPAPADRYQEAAALVEELDRFLQDRPVRARRAGWCERAWRWRRRNPALAAACLLAGVLLAALAVVAGASHARLRRAYGQAQAALHQAEATSRLSLEVLDRIYARLAPDRVRLSVGLDAAACACVGFRSAAPGPPADEAGSAEVPASPETARLLHDLLRFYDQLAEQAGGGDEDVILAAASARRRVGDIRWRLGETAQAEQAYLAAAARLGALAARRPGDGRIAAELARSLNALGDVRTARGDPGGAWRAHQQARCVLEPRARRPEATPEQRYELARTLYLLSTKPRPGGPGSPNGRRAAAPMRAWRAEAVRLLERLADQHPQAPDVRFLLALCKRPLARGGRPAWDWPQRLERQRAIQILEQLVAEYPERPDYRYELAATYAWLPVSLFPWQPPTTVSAGAVRSLEQAREHLDRLVQQHPASPQYAFARALVLAKLGAAHWSRGDGQEAQRWFRRAAAAQQAALQRAPAPSRHEQALCEFYRLRLAQTLLDRPSGEQAARQEAAELLASCQTNLRRLAAQTIDAPDRLIASCLAALNHTLERTP